MIPEQANNVLRNSQKPVGGEHGTGNHTTGVIVTTVIKK